MDTTNKPVWFITGCSTGFGRELTKQILARGWNAVATARHAYQIQDLVAGYENTALALPLDVTDPTQIATAVAKAQATFGRIDVLVNNAGYGYFSSIEEGEEEKIRAQFETNFFGLVNVIKSVLPGMREKRHGHIVNFSSLGGLLGFPSTGYYHATKFAVEGLSESLAQEVAPLGIKVLLVEPGPFRTDWLGRSPVRTPVQLEDYQATTGARMKNSEEREGHQQGDPVRGCEAIIQAVTQATPYLRLLLGKLAFDMAMEKTISLKENFEAMKDLTLGADFPASL
ncbi:NADP-dependent 3-hydroxy acid dehydrogenase YdfG [Chitinophaga costaii]|uniref:NADP-dependent 3-hydroxy acid dehydrogenase YdfG n=1 Tax=Chitinophaga costaii TaxID=1335309 RepID=A0A1C3Z1Q7_9BACT|nr:oxidoreductase [Chitinophaga costaii]PUZ30194.1 KR domain-containing protein [Chitinophaga costaii]SCB76230.1 NADP-dependent 3-hydroxy acid dehydrogenase YdfG [Chitinophaga costaii]